MSFQIGSLERRDHRAGGTDKVGNMVGYRA